MARFMLLNSCMKACASVGALNVAITWISLGLTLAQRQAMRYVMLALV